MDKNLGTHFRGPQARWPNRRKVVIRPRSIGPDVTIEAYSELDAAESFCRLVGLMMVEHIMINGETPHIEFMIGTGNRFYAFAAPES